MSWINPKLHMPDPNALPTANSQVSPGSVGFGWNLGVGWNLGGWEGVGIWDLEVGI